MSQEEQGRVCIGPLKNGKVPGAEDVTAVRKAPKGVMGKSEKTWPVGSKRANLEPRDGKEKDKMQ